MTNITLRDYCQKIESLIDLGNYDEAIFHSLAILNVYPKYTAAYRNLGKALLESKRYQEASDIFAKVLSVFPDDFISHVGLSAISENDLDLEKAIWHMERAFDSQPSNVVVQEELRRLLGRRDGAAPNKIRLSRGALIRMYLKGELYQQAIAEIHAFQKNDPSRIDLEVILARIYSITGRLDEAVEISRKIIDKLPYCYEPNKILSLHGDLAEKNTHRSRLIEIDPYYQFVNEQYGSSEDVPADMVLFELETYNSPDHREEEIPAWARQIGLNWSQEQPSGEELPWSDDRVSPFVADPSAEPIADNPLESKNDEENLPDWMKNAGWTKESGFDESNPSERIEEESQFEPIVPPTESQIAEQADALPSWMDDFRIEERESEELPQTSESTSVDLNKDESDNFVPEWILEGKEESDNPQLVASDLPVSPENLVLPEQQVDLPDWLKNYDVDSHGTEPSGNETKIPDDEEPLPSDESFVQVDQEGFLAEPPVEPITTNENEYEPTFLVDDHNELTPLDDQPTQQPENNTVPDWVRKILGGSSITSALKEEDFQTENQIEDTSVPTPDFLEPDQTLPAQPSTQENLEPEIPEFITELPEGTKSEGLLSEDTNDELISWLNEVSSEELLETSGETGPEVIIPVDNGSENLDLSVDSLLDQEAIPDIQSISELTTENSIEKEIEIPELDDRLTNLIDELPDNQKIDQWLNQSSTEEPLSPPVESSETNETPGYETESDDLFPSITEAEMPVDQNHTIIEGDNPDSQVQLSSMEPEAEEELPIPGYETQPSLIEQLMTELKIDPSSISKLRDLGDAYFQENRIEEALDAYSQAELLLITPTKE